MRTIVEAYCETAAALVDQLKFPLSGPFDPNLSRYMPLASYPGWREAIAKAEQQRAAATRVSRR